MNYKQGRMWLALALLVATVSACEKLTDGGRVSEKVIYLEGRIYHVDAGTEKIQIDTLYKIRLCPSSAISSEKIEFYVDSSTFARVSIGQRWSPKAGKRHADSIGGGDDADAG